MEFLKKTCEYKKNLRKYKLVNCLIGIRPSSSADRDDESGFPAIFHRLVDEPPDPGVRRLERGHEGGGLLLDDGQLLTQS